MTDPVALRRDDLANLITMASTGQWDPIKNPAMKESFDRAVTLKDAAEAGHDTAPAEPPLPPGEFARVEIMGHDSVTGWVTDGTRAGVPVMIVRGWDGRVMREVPGQSLYQFFPLATPLRRPEPLAALPAGEPRCICTADEFGEIDVRPDCPARHGMRACGCRDTEECDVCRSERIPF